MTNKKRSDFEQWFINAVQEHVNDFEGALHEIATDEGAFDHLHGEMSENHYQDQIMEAYEDWLDKSFLKGDLSVSLHKLLTKLTEEPDRQSVVDRFLSPYRRLAKEAEYDDCILLVPEKAVNKLAGRIMEVLETLGLNETQHSAVKKLLFREINSLRDEPDVITASMLDELREEAFPFVFPMTGDDDSFIAEI